MMTTHTQPSSEQRNDEGRVAGMLLIGLGALFLLGQLFNLGAWILPILGVTFLVIGGIKRQAGWMIPGGILSGLALGVFVVEGPFTIAEPAAGGLFLIAFASGWLLIYLASRLLTEEAQVWALIPAGIMALTGGFVLLSEWNAPLVDGIIWLISVAWPLVLIGIGQRLLLRRRAE
jgi:hypothetical protein